MNWPEIYLICFGFGTLWAIVSLFLGGFHFGHWGHAHGHAHAVHGHAGHAHLPGWMLGILSPSAIAVFLAWFGGAGYLLTKYSGLAFWVNLGIASALGLTGASLLAAFLSWLMGHERPLNPADFDMIGVLGRVSSTIRAGGVGEFIYIHEGVRRLACARSEMGEPIARGEEVIVTHFDKGIASVRTWAAMTQQGGTVAAPETSSKENSNVQ